MMKPLGSRVLIERIETQIKRKIIIKGEPEFNTIKKTKVLDFGSGCPDQSEVKVGDHVILNEHTRPSGLILTSDEKDTECRVYQGIVYFDEIAAIDELAEEKKD
jgi:co-chaperonin GroES (HSP10)